MKHHRNNPLLLATSTLAGFVLTAAAAHAADLTWDITSGDGATITPGTGAWNTTAGNLVLVPIFGDYAGFALWHNLLHTVAASNPSANLFQ